MRMRIIKKKYIYGNKGFTLPEILMASVIMMLVTISIISVSMMTNTTWVRSLDTMSLLREGNIVMERIVRGVQGTGETKLNGLREAESYVIPVVIPGGSRINFTSGIDSKERSFFLDIDKITYDADTSTTGDKVVIADDINSLVFQAVDSKEVNVKITLSKNIHGKDVYEEISTNVRIRN